MSYDLVIKNANIVDGSGSQAQRGRTPISLTAAAPRRNAEASPSRDGRLWRWRRLFPAASAKSTLTV